MSRSEVFVGFYFQLSPNWQQPNAALAKLFYLYQASGGNRQANFMCVAGGTGGPLTLQISNEAGGGAWWGQNVQNVVLVPGRWYRFELYEKRASASGVADGVVRWWIDGTLAADYSTALTRGELYSEFHLDPVWGGNAGGRKQHDDFLRFDHIYLSGR
jgi:hypothetical protein